MTQRQFDRRTALTLGAIGLAGTALGMRAVLAHEGHDDEATPVATPGATLGATPAAAEEVAVEMVDIDFNPNEFTIPAETDVTVHLANNGAIVHNFNIDDNNNPSDPDIHSGDVQPGESTTITINLPAGDWYYYCNVPGHEQAGMHGTVHAEEEG